MDKVTLKRIIEDRLFSLAGNDFQDLCDRLCLILHPDDYTPVRAGGPHGDSKNDGYCPKARIFFAAHATRGEKTSATKKKIKEDLEGCLVQHRDVRKWVYLTNDTLLGEVEQFVDELRREHLKVKIETWGHKKLTDKILSLSPSDVADVIEYDLSATVQISAEIDYAVQMLKEQKCPESLALLGRLWLQHSGSMSARQKYRTGQGSQHPARIAGPIERGL